MYESLLIRDDRRIGRRTIDFGHYQITIVRLQGEVIKPGDVFIPSLRYALMEGDPSVDEMKHFVHWGWMTGGLICSHGWWVNDFRIMMKW